MIEESKEVETKEEVTEQLPTNEKVEKQTSQGYKVDIISEKENIIFERKEIKGSIFSNSGTPPKSYVLSYLSSKYKIPESNIEIKYIINKPGRRIAEFFALIYNKPIKKEEDKKESN